MPNETVNPQPEQSPTTESQAPIVEQSRSQEQPPRKPADALGNQLAQVNRRSRALEAEANKLKAEKEELARQRAEVESFAKLPPEEFIERKAKELGVSYEEVLREVIAKKLGQKQEAKAVDPETRKLQEKLAALEKQIEDERTEKQRIIDENQKRQYLEEVQRDCLKVATDTLKAAPESDMVDLAFESEAEFSQAVWNLAIETVRKYQAKFGEPPKDEEIRQFIREDAGKELVKRWKSSERYKKLSQRISFKQEPERDDKYTRRMKSFTEDPKTRKETAPSNQDEPRSESSAERKARIRRELSNPDIVLPGERLIQKVG